MMRVFLRPASKDEDYDSDDERRRRKRARRDAASGSRSADCGLASIAATVAADCCDRDKMPEVAKRLCGSLQWTLKPFQLEGVSWAVDRIERCGGGGGYGVILADEMGLGKTVQGIATYLALARAPQRASVSTTTMKLLVVAPLSVVPTWIHELATAVNHTEMPIRVVRYGGTREERDALISTVERSLASSPSVDAAVSTNNVEQNVFDVLVTTPEYLSSDAFFLLRLHFDMLVFDEAHRLKSSQSRLYQTLLSSIASIRCRLFLTGTPLANTPIELYNLLRLLNPSLLAPCRSLNGYDSDGDELSSAAVEKAFHKNPSNAAALKKLADALLLRRLKKDVLDGLPPITEVRLLVPLSPLQLRMYAGVLRKDASLLLTLGSGSAASSNTTSLLNTLMQLRKVCNHPYMFPGVEAEPFAIGEHIVLNSGKLALLDKLLKKLSSEGHRVLLFSQFSFMLDILQDYLEYRDYNYVRLDGSVRGEDREIAVNTFQGADDKNGLLPFVFLLSTRAGGVGLTLTAADTVVFYDHDWNPQMDLQAQQRAHRIGQDKPVTVYRLCSQHTVEEAILRVATQKLRIANEFVVTSAPRTAATDTSVDDDTAAAKMTAAELKLIVKLGVAAAVPHVFSAGAAAPGDEVARIATWEAFVASLDIEALMSNAETAQQHVSDASTKEEEEDRKAFERNLQLQSDAALETLRKEQAASAAAAAADCTRTRRPREGDVSLVALPSMERPKATEADRLVKLGKQWTKSGYVTTALPLDAALYPRVSASSSGTDAAAAITGCAMRHWASLPTGIPKAVTDAFFPPTPPSDAALPRVDKDGDDLGEESCDVSVKHIHGDLFRPVLAPELLPKNRIDSALLTQVVVLPVNNSGSWGSGRLFSAAASLVPQIPAQYAAAKEQHDLRLGDTHLFWAAPPSTDALSPPSLPQRQVLVALVVIQKGSTSDRTSGGEVDFKALATAMDRLSAFTHYLLNPLMRMQHLVSYHFPLFSALSKEAAYALDKLLAKYVSEKNIACYLYHAPPRHRPARGDAEGRLLARDKLSDPAAPLRSQRKAALPATAAVRDNSSHAASPLASCGEESVWSLESAAPKSYFLMEDPNSRWSAAVARRVLLLGGVFTNEESITQLLLSGEEQPGNVVCIVDYGHATATAHPLAARFPGVKVLSHTELC